ncbi:MAG: ATP-binding protein [Campylobacterota bacterium]|nr:ATP-binding protein [Campylobacterota bacterium]
MIIQDLEKLKCRSILTTVVIFIVIIAFRVYDDIEQYDYQKEHKINSIFKQTDYIYTSKINIINRTFTNRLQSVVSQKKIKDAIKNRDRETLYKISMKRFKTIKRDFPTLNLMHYHLPDHTSLLRLHKKDKYGDNLKDKRAMITKAIDTKSTQIGFESGLYDELDITYRVAIPIMENKKLLSVVELGINTQGISNKIDDFFDAGFDGEVLIGFLLQKDINSNKNIIQNSRMISEEKLLYEIVQKIDSNKHSQYIEMKDKVYFVFWGKQKLKDFNVNDVGTIIYAFDITKLENEFQKSLIISIVKPIIMMILTFFMLIWLFNYIIKQSKLNQIKISNIVDNQSAIIVVTNGKKIIQANKSFLEFFDMKSLEMFTEQYDCICNKFEKIDGYLQKEYENKNWLEYLKLNQNTIHKTIMQDVDGKQHIYQVNYKEFIQNDDTEYIVTFEDITQLEDELKKNRQKDQHIVQQSRLAQMGEMISMIAHQWRQPLAAISSTSAGINLKAQLNKLDKETAVELSNKISDYSQHLSSTINDFREFFKSNKEKRDTTFNDIVNSVLNIVETSVENKNITLIKNLNCTNRFNTYPNEIKQVVLNLIKNAEDVLIEKDIQNPKIIIESDCGVLTISDNGGGIPDDIMPKIFDPYFSTKTKKDGTGLGLYMSKTIIEEHCGGELRVSNDEVINQDGKPSCGAVFTIRLKANNG